MTTARALHTPLSQQVLSLSLAAMVTTAVLAGLVGLAGGDQAALLAQRAQAAPQAIALVLVPPTA